MMVDIGKKLEAAGLLSDTKPSPPEVAMLLATPAPVTAATPVTPVVILPAGPAGVRVADIIEKTAQPFAGCLGHVIVVEQDSVVCVQQPSQASSLTWFRVQNSHFRIVGRAIGRYKIPPDEIQRRIDALKPVKINLDNFDEPAVAG